MKNVISALSSLDKANLSFEQIFPVCINNKLPAALYRLPGEKNVNLVIGELQKISHSDLELESANPGFLISAFDHQKFDHDFFIHSDIHFQTEAEPSLNPLAGTDRLNFYLDIIYSDVNSKIVNAESSNPPPGFNSNQLEETYQELVSLALQKIEEGEFKKVVPARAQWIELPADFNPVQSFNALGNKYQHAFLSLVHLPGIGTWLGASPELLLKVENNRLFYTTALAGTQLYQENMKLSQAAWTQKEIEEQALVSRFIIDCFKKIRLREFEEYGPCTVRAANLIHLKTDFLVDMVETNFLQLGTTMLKLLHPTSAICGMPRTNSFNFLKANESFEREFFSGYLGPVNLNRQTSLFVNIRCMQWKAPFGIFYAGAGVTKDSDPVKEWKETGHKIDTLKSIILP